MLDANILEVATKHDVLEPTVLRMLKDKLLRWFDQLPTWLQLKAVLDLSQTGLTNAQIHVACYLHMFHLAAMALKTRIVLSALIERADNPNGAAAIDALHDGLLAARVCGQILSLLFQRQLVFPRCWLCT